MKGLKTDIRNTRELQNERANLFYTLFPGDGVHHGNVILALKKNAGVLSPFGFSPCDRISEYVKTMKFHDCNYYFSLNTFTRNSTRTEELFSLCNIVVDIDCHKKIHWKERKEAETEFKKIMQRDLERYEIEIPSLYTATGRGFQVFWNIHQVPASFINTYKKVAEDLADKMQKMISENPYLSSYSVDKAVSVNASAFVRMPATYNTTAQKEGLYWFVNGPQIDLNEYWKKHIRTKSSEEHIIYKKACYKTGQGDYSEMAAYITKALEKLVKLRQYDGTYEAGNEYRNNTLLCVASQYSEKPWEEVLEKVYEFNKLFIVPMSEQEIERYLSSFKKKRYRYSINRICQFLDITDQEAEKCGLQKRKKNTTRSSGKKRVHKDHMKDICKEVATLVNAGMYNNTIAQELNISATTVKRLIEKMGLVSVHVKKECTAKKLIRKGFSVQCIAEKTGYSVRQIYNIRKELIERKKRIQRDKENRILQKEKLLKLKKEKEEAKRKMFTMPMYRTPKEIDDLIDQGYEVEIVATNSSGLKRHMQFLASREMEPLLVLSQVLIERYHMESLKPLIEQYGVNDLFHPDEAGIKIPESLMFDYLYLKDIGRFRKFKT